MAVLNYFVIDRAETGKRIFENRKAMQLTREGLAGMLAFEGIDITPVSIWKWETGRCDISEEHARTLAKLFGCRLCELVVARLSFYDDERDQLAPLIITYYSLKASICDVLDTRLFC